MSAQFDTAVDELRTRLAESPVEGSFKFDIADEGVILIRDGEIGTEDGEADVTLRADMETFRQIFSGEIAAAAAVMTGKVEIEGDMGMAMRLSALVE